MKTVVCHLAEGLRIEHTELPALGQHQLRVNVAYGGICGSDLHDYQHGGFGTVRIQQPIALGHEISGVVDAVVDDVGAGVSGVPQGQRIAISPSRPCGHCRFCQAGQHNHCLNMRLYGGDISLPMTQIVAKKVDLRGTFRFHAKFATAVRFLNEGLVNGKPVITGSLPVDRTLEAIDLAADKSQSLKVQISFQNA
jgi:threonine dehydrogenase-like Zn-dependent dehydrogenase